MNTHPTLDCDYGRDGFDAIVYCERYEETIRETALGFTKTGGAISVWGFSFGWQKVIIHPKTLTGWHSPHQNLPFTEDDRKRVVSATLNWLSDQGCLAKVEDSN